MKNSGKNSVQSSGKFSNFTIENLCDLESSFDAINLARGTKKATADHLSLMAEAVHAENASCYLVSPADGALELHAWYDREKGKSQTVTPLDWTGKRFQLGEGVIGRAAASVVPYLIDDIQDVDEFLPLEESQVQVRSLICRPFDMPQICKGCYNFSSSKPGFFTDESRYLLDFMLMWGLRRIYQHYFEDIQDSSQFEGFDKGFFRFLMDSLPFSVAYAKGKYLQYTNQAFLDTFGMTKEEAMSTEFFKLFSPESRDVLTEQTLARARGERAPERLIIPVVGAEGKKRWLDVGARKVDYKDFESGVIACGTDVTNILNSLKDLHEKENWYSQIMESFSDGMYILDSQLRIQFMNEAFRKLCNISSAKIGEKCHVALHDQNRPCSNCPALEVYKRKIPQRGRITQKIRAGGKIRKSVLAYPILSSTNILKGVLCILDGQDDKAEKKGLSRELRKTRPDLIRCILQTASTYEGLSSIEECIPPLAETMGCTRTHLFRIPDDGSPVELLYEWLRDDMIPPIEMDEELVLDKRSWLIRRENCVKSLVFAEDTLPPEIRPEEKALLGFPHASSALAIVLMDLQGEKPIGLLQLDETEEDANWSGSQIALLEDLSGPFSMLLQVHNASM